MRKWVIFFVFLMVIFGVLYYLTFGYYSEGKRGGFITKLSNKGYMFKTYEGELKVGGLYEGDGTMNSTNWAFSVSSKNKDGIAKLEEAIKTGQRVSLTYEEKFFTLPWNGETKYFVTDVEVLQGSRGNNFPATPPTPLPSPTEIDTTKVL